VGDDNRDNTNRDGLDADCVTDAERLGVQGELLEVRTGESGAPTTLCPWHARTKGALPQSPKEKFQVRKLQKHKTERVPTSASPETAPDSLWFRYGKAKNFWFFPYVQNETVFKIKGVTRTTSRVTHYTITHTTKNTNADEKIKN